MHVTITEFILILDMYNGKLFKEDIDKYHVGVCNLIYEDDC